MTSRVVITGMGVVSPLGGDLEATWQAMLNGESGIGPISIFDPSGYPTRIAAEVKNYDVESWLEDRALLKYLGRGGRFGVAATQMALADASLKQEDYPPESTGVSLATCGGRPSLESLAFIPGHTKSFRRQVSRDRNGISPGMDPLHQRRYNCTPRERTRTRLRGAYGLRGQQPSYWHRIQDDPAGRG
jgi:3-oxoacyl-(acyl-carrier-protein) synthase